MENIEQKEDQIKIKQSKQSSWSVPAAIVIAGLLIAGAVIFGNDGQSNSPQGNNAPAGNDQVQNEEAKKQSALDSVAPITENDHILGDINAPVKIIEYSDTECPFCKRFHDTMNQVVNEYGKDGKVAWVYRHFPLDSLHKKARKEAEATECANELGGNAKFWEYTNKLFEITPSNDRLDLAELPNIAKQVGLDVNKFNECLDSGRYADHITKDLENAVATGGRGTPWSILIAKDGKKFPINGALPYAQVKTLIDASLK